MKILVADDEKEKERAYRRIFARKGYSDVTFTLTPTETIAALKTQCFDIVILDINFEEDIDGFDVLQQTKQLCPKTKFIMSSAYSDFREKSFALGAHEFLLKPINMDNLFDLIKHFEIAITQKEGVC